MRGDVHEMKAPRDARGNEQKGERFGVVVQSSLLPLTTLVVCPTSTRARPTSFRPEIEIGDEKTWVMVDQMTCVAPERLGRQVAYLSAREMATIDHALAVVLGLTI